MKRIKPLTFSMLVASALASGCTHFVVNEPAQPVNNAANGKNSVNETQSSQQIAKRVIRSQECTASNHVRTSMPYYKVDGKKSDAIRIRVTGYGAPPKSFYPEPQRRLMAMRAAKIDAYRSLAERVKGVQIWGGTTIGDMVVEKDRFRVYLDTHLSGARVIAENPSDDGTFETIVELKVDQNFLKGAGIEPQRASQQRAPVAQPCPPANNPAPMAAPNNPPSNAESSFDDDIQVMRFTPVKQVNATDIAKSDFYFSE
jgi:hypothetical protein